MCDAEEDGRNDGCLPGSTTEERMEHHPAEERFFNESDCQGKHKEEQDTPNPRVAYTSQNHIEDNWKQWNCEEPQVKRIWRETKSCFAPPMETAEEQDGNQCKDAISNNDDCQRG